MTHFKVLKIDSSHIRIVPTDASKQGHFLKGRPKFFGTYGYPVLHFAKSTDLYFARLYFPNFREYPNFR